MAYSSPRDTRRNKINLRLSDHEKDMLERLARLQHEQPSTLAHDLVVEALQEALNDEKLKQVLSGTREAAQ